MRILASHLSCMFVCDCREHSGQHFEPEGAARAVSAGEPAVRLHPGRHRRIDWSDQAGAISQRSQRYVCLSMLRLIGDVHFVHCAFLYLRLRMCMFLIVVNARVLRFFELMWIAWVFLTVVCVDVDVGPIPDSICHLTALAELDLSCCLLTGKPALMCGVIPKYVLFWHGLTEGKA